MNPILYTSKTCPTSSDFKLYAEVLGVKLTTKDIDNENPHNVTHTPCVSYKDELHVGLDSCTAFIRREFKAKR